MKTNKSRDSLPYRLFIMIPMAAALLALLFFSWQVVRESHRLRSLEQQIAAAEEENHALREELGFETEPASAEADTGNNG